MTTRPGRWGAVVLVSLSLFASGMVVGQALQDGTGPSARTATEAAADGDEAQSNSIRSIPRVDGPPGAGVEVRSPAGAVAAAAALVVAFDGAGILDRDRRERLLDQHAARASRDRLDEVLGEVAETVTTRLGLGPEELDDDHDFVWRVVPAGWQVREFDGDRAVVAVWATGVVIARGLPLVHPGWHTTEVEMVWERGGWRLVGFRSEPGPQPPAVGASTGASSQARLIDAFRPFRHLRGAAVTATR